MSSDYTDEHGAHAPLSAREQAARLQEGCAADDDSPHPRFFLGLAWALGISAVIWGGLLIVAMEMSQ